MPDVFWLISAQRDFVNCQTPPFDPETAKGSFELVCRKLAATFPGAAGIIVRRRFSGYTTKPDLHVLLVEVVWRCHQVALWESETEDSAADECRQSICIGWPDFCEPKLGQSTQTTAHVVKVADRPDDLKKELTAWESCRPIGMTHDSVLMRLRSGFADSKSACGSPVSIVYEDAHHVIGAGLVLSLEDAVLRSCSWGTPSVESIGALLRCLFERLGTDFYVRSQTKPEPADNLTKLRQWKDLDDAFASWRDSRTPDSGPSLDRLRIRREVLGLLASQRNCFIDPVDYLKSVFECPEFCPVLLWGCSHGDLHGRNILVSILDDDVNLPALFDYEEMSLDNAVGWDFVKLETELKVRALPSIFPGREPQFIERILRFERHLADCTQMIHDQDDQRPVYDAPLEAQRLANVILTIRKQARRHLGLQHQRDRQWLEEYYFLLACYGVRCACYPTYQGIRRQITAAYISAGVAARHLSRPWRQLEAKIREAKLLAQRVCQQIKQSVEEDKVAPVEWKQQLEEAGEMTHDARLAFAKECARAGQNACIEIAVEVLRKLREDYPHVLAVEEELALSYLELGRTEEANELLDEVQLRYNQLSEETLCRMGRIWKDRGTELLDSKPVAAIQPLQYALEWYRRAYDLRQDYYPGINVATLNFFLGNRGEAQRIAEAVLESTLQGQVSRDQQPWIWATQAEAYLLLASFPGHESAEVRNLAEELYYQAATNSPPSSVDSMRRQAELILNHSASEVREFWTEAKLSEVFKLT